MCNLYEYDMTPEVMQSLKDRFGLVGAGYLDVLRGRNGPQRVYPNYEAPVIRSLATLADLSDVAEAQEAVQLTVDHGWLLVEGGHSICLTDAGRQVLHAV